MTDSAAASIVKGARITGRARDDLATQVRHRYEGGESIRTMAAELGRSYGFVHRLLRDADVPLRSRGGARHRSHG